jgi:hypothetical protein
MKTSWYKIPKTKEEMSNKNEIIEDALCVYSPFPPHSFIRKLTTGALPFDGASRAQIMESILHSSAPPVGGGFSVALKVAIAHMLEKVFFCLWVVMFFFFLCSGSGEEADSERSVDARGSEQMYPATRPGHALLYDRYHLSC